MRQQILDKAKVLSEKYNKLMRGEKLEGENGVMDTEYQFWLTQARQLLADENPDNDKLLVEWDKRANLDNYRFNPKLVIQQYAERHVAVYAFLVKNIKGKSQEKEKQKAYCYKCEDDTNQIVLFKDTSFGPQEIVGRNEEGDESQSVWMVAATIWTITKCQGCEKINLTHITRTDPDRKTDRVFHFPYKFIRTVPSWTFKLPIKYLEILQEIYATLNQELFILSLTGTRILLDTYMVHKVGDTGTFKQKIAKLVSEGFITQSKAKVLEATIEAGNAAAHRGFKPDKETLFDILDIIENLLQSEIVDRKGKKIKEKTPARK